MGQEDIRSVACNAATASCDVSVPAPGFALVFLGDSGTDGGTFPAPQTYATTARTRTHNTATVDKAVLATSNGHRGMSSGWGSTSRGREETGGAMLLRVPGVVALGGVVGGALALRGALLRQWW
jgi:hypothetical protein